MYKKQLGNTGIEVTPVGFGVLAIGSTQLNLSIEDGADIIRYALEKGINFLDTAQYYRTYPYIREALKGTSYDPVIVSKCLDSDYDDMKYAVEEARRELDRDLIDIFLLHEVRSEQDFNYRLGAWEYLQEAKARGLVKAIGVSTHHVDVAELVAENPEADVLFPLINFKSMGIRKGHGFGTKEEMAEAIKKAAGNGKGVFAMKVFGGGILINDYRKALEYAFSLDGVHSLMIGFGNRDEVDRIIEMVEGTLDPNYTPDLSNKKIWIEQGDCEGCGNCIERCPNEALYVNDIGLAYVDHSICIRCGYCAPVCPSRAIIMIG
ncbi:MAG: 4Fe-4S binding protein [Clostridiales bacterium]|nr:4Fe-4S binding protein [Clostridiales bacterium]